MPYIREKIIYNAEQMLGDFGTYPNTENWPSSKESPPKPD